MNSESKKDQDTSTTKLMTVHEMAKLQTKEMEEASKLKKELQALMLENDRLKTALQDIIAFANFNGETFEVRAPYFHEGTMALKKCGINSKVESDDNISGTQENTFFDG